MNADSTSSKEPLSDSLTQTDIQNLIDERRAQGATSCEVVTENGQRFLVCQWPPP